MKVSVRLDFFPDYLNSNQENSVSKAKMRANEQVLQEEYILLNRNGLVFVLFLTAKAQV